MAREPRKSPPKRRRAPKGSEPKAEAAPAYAYDAALGARIKDLATVGTAKSDIARVVGIGTAIIDKYYRDDWEDGHASGNVRLRVSGFQMAVGRPNEYDKDGKLLRAELPPDKSMAIFLHKARLGYKEIQGIEHTGKDGAPISTSELDLSVLTDEEYDLFKALYEKARKRAVEARAEAEATGRKPT